MTILKDIAWRIVSTSPFDPIRPRICHSNMYRLTGKTKRSKHELSTIVFGRRETSEYFSKLVYLDEPMPEFLGRLTFSDIPSSLEDATEDIVIVETDWSFLGFLRDNGFLVLPQINFALDITGSWETIRGRLARSKVRRMSRVVEAGYTFEITKDTHLTLRGDCIIAVDADKSLSDLSDEFKRILHNNDAKIRITIKVDNEKEEVVGCGNTKLTFASPTSIVIRRSSYVCDRTLAIRANKSAGNLSRSLVAKLKDPKNRVVLELAVDNED